MKGKTKTVPVMTKNDAFCVHGLDTCLWQDRDLTPTSESEEGSVTEAKEEKEKRAREGREGRRRSPCVFVIVFHLLCRADLICRCI